MVEAINEALTFSAGRSREHLEDDRMLVLALIKDLEIVGEAANKVTNETRTLLPSIPWNDIIGMRNHLIHGYFDVDLDLVWDTLTKDLPTLLSQLEQALKAEK
jgi:uncharacterized protein with HEPN domain